MRHVSIAVLILLLAGCAAVPIKSVCIGSVELPVKVAASFEPVDDNSLLNQALGAPGKGSLCQGKVYKANDNAEVTIYRSWNSTNPNSRFGNWWAFDRANGKVAQYRSDYEICYQWSPLDKLTQCRLKGGTKIVVGNGQSATCSQYLTYGVSAAKQIYIDHASSSVSDCKDFDLLFNWVPETGEAEH